MMDIVDRINDGCDLMPNIYEGLKCYPFNVEVKKLSSGSNHGSGASFIGSLFKKFTNWYNYKFDLIIFNL